MRKPPLGLREYVALAVLVAAVGVALYLFNDGSGSGSPALRAFDTPHKPIAGESDWQVSYVAVGASDDIVVASAFTKTLDIDLAEPPDPALQRGRWKVRAEMRLAGPPGTYQGRLRFEGTVNVFLNGVSLNLNTVSRSHEVVFPVEVDAAGTVIRVEVRDAAGPVSVHWSLLRPR